MKLIRVGVDLAKNVFQVHGVGRNEKAVWRRKLSRENWLKVLLETAEPGCEIGMESCGGAHHWARRLQAHGFKVRMIAPQFVKPYVKSNKNDANDAEAICEAMSRPHMRFVAVKTVEQQDAGHDASVVVLDRKRLQNAEEALLRRIAELSLRLAQAELSLRYAQAQAREATRLSGPRARHVAAIKCEPVHATVLTRQDAQQTDARVQCFVQRSRKCRDLERERTRRRREPRPAIGAEIDGIVHGAVLGERRGRMLGRLAPPFQRPAVSERRGVCCSRSRASCRSPISRPSRSSSGSGAC